MAKRIPLTDSVKVATRAQNTLLHMVLMLNVWLISWTQLHLRLWYGRGYITLITSMENNTPPIGEPKATATPAALAAVTISLILPTQLFQFDIQWMGVWETYFDFGGNYQKNQPPMIQYSTQHVPKGLLCQRRVLKLWPVARGDHERTRSTRIEFWLTSVILLIKKVAEPRNPCITKPARIHLISEMPEPAAYLARDRTRWEATNEKPHCISEVNANRTQRQQLSIWSEITHGKQHEDHPACQCYMTPGMPWITAIYFFSFYFPTTELLV